MKCNQSHPGFELVSPCTFPTTITITPQAPFLMGISPKVSMIVWLELELIYFDLAIQCFNHYATVIPRYEWQEFFQAVASSVLMYGWIGWNVTKNLLDGNYTIRLHAVLDKSCKQHLMKQQLYGHLLLISQTILVRWARHNEGEERMNL